MFDVCVIGHITRDIIRMRGRGAREMPGGTVYYTTMALRSLGLTVAAMTKVAQRDREALLGGLEAAGVVVLCRESTRTTSFENIYPGENLDERIQIVRAVAAPFTLDDAKGVSAILFHLGPLTNREISPEVLRAVSSRGDMVSLDVQGLLRRIEGEEVGKGDWQDKHEGLAYVDILKADEEEARVLSGEDSLEKAAVTLSQFGPREVVITLGRSGSLIFAEGEFYRIPPHPARKVVDPTGCGDTYMAGYLYHRLKSKDIGKAGRFGALLASRKLEKSGCLSGKG